MALLRRLEKRILVPLPNAAARTAMFEGLLAGRCAADVSAEKMAARTDGYSGSGTRRHADGCNGCSETDLLIGVLWRNPAGGLVATKRDR